MYFIIRWNDSNVKSHHHDDVVRYTKPSKWKCGALPPHAGTHHQCASLRMPVTVMAIRDVIASLVKAVCFRLNVRVATNDKSRQGRNTVHLNRTSVAKQAMTGNNNM